MEENKKQKIGFFKRLKIAIFKLEDYGFFLGERFKVALKYFLLLMLLISIVVSAVDAYTISKMLSKGKVYLENEFPEFTYEEGVLNLNEKIDAYDHEYEFKLLVDTTENLSDEEIKDYKTKTKNNPYGIILLRDKFIYVASGIEAEYDYEEFLNSSSLEIKNKEDLISVFFETATPAVLTTFFAVDLLTVYIANNISTFTDVIVIALFGLIAARFCGLKFKVLPMFSIGIYSLSLSLVLTAIYSVVYGLTGFVINYFNVMYLLIAYVYIIAAILMIKYDLIKQHFELEKILEVQKQVHEEMEQEEKEKEEKEKNEEDKKEDSKEEKKEEDSEGAKLDNDNREPDGSEI